MPSEKRGKVRNEGKLSPLMGFFSRIRSEYRPQWYNLGFIKGRSKPRAPENFPPPSPAPFGSAGPQSEEGEADAQHVVRETAAL